MPVTDEIIIASSASSARLRLHSPEAPDPHTAIDSFALDLTSGTLSVSVRCWAIPFDNVPQLFSEMAENWHGSEGKTFGGTYEGDLSFECTSDRCGHAFLEVVLRSREEDNEWTLTLPLRLDAQQLIDLVPRLWDFWHYKK